MFSWYKYLIVSLFFSRLGFGSDNLFLIAPFPDRCPLVPFHINLFIGEACIGNFGIRDIGLLFKGYWDICVFFLFLDM